MWSKNSLLEKRFLGGILGSLISTIGYRVTNFLYLFIAASLLGKQNFGVFSAIQNNLFLFATIAMFGLDLTIIRYVAEYRREKPEKLAYLVSFFLFSSFFLAIFFLLLFFVAIPHINNGFNLQSFELTVYLAGLLILTGNFQLCLNAVLNAFEHFIPLSRINFFCSLPVLFFSLPLIENYSLNGLFSGLLLTNLLNIFFLTKYLQKKLELKIVFPQKIVFSELNILWFFSLPVLLSAIITAFANWFGSLFLSNQPGGLSELGLFNVASQWRNLLLLIPQAVSSGILPLLTNIGIGENRSFKKILFFNLLINLLVTSFLFLLLFFFSDLILLSYGKEFLAARNTLLTLCASSILIALCNSTGTVLVSLEKMWQGFFFNLFWLVLFIYFSYFFVSQGANGLAKAFFLAYFGLFILQTIVLVFYFKRLEQFFLLKKLKL